MDVIYNREPLTEEEIAQRWANHVDFSRQDFRFIRDEDQIIGELNDHLVSQLTFYYKKPDGTSFSTPRKILKKDYYFRYWSGLWDHIDSFVPELAKEAPSNCTSLTISVNMTFRPDEDPFKINAKFEFKQEGEDIPLKFMLPPWGTDARYMGTCMKKALESQAYWRKFKQHHPDAVLR